MAPTEILARQHYEGMVRSFARYGIKVGFLSGSMRMIASGFVLKRFDEHPSWENEKMPGEFTAVAVKQAVEVKRI